jgi:DnaJ-class molecular chaperone
LTNVSNDLAFIFTLYILYISAYEVLSDSDKRKRYDQFGDAGDGNGGGPGDGGFGSHFDFNFNDFFKNFDHAFDGHKHRHHDHDGFTFTFGQDGGSFN